jgi:hypothetical protein
MNPRFPDLGHICNPPWLWWWSKRRWKDGMVWECPVCQRRWLRNDREPIGWEWLPDEGD